jgi:hypothetical protein
VASIVVAVVVMEAEIAVAAVVMEEGIAAAVTEVEIAEIVVTEVTGAVAEIAVTEGIVETAEIAVAATIAAEGIDLLHYSIDRIPQVSGFVIRQVLRVCACRLSFPR